MKYKFFSFMLLFVMTMVTAVGYSSDGATDTKTAYGGAYLVMDLDNSISINAEISVLTLNVIGETDNTIRILSASKAFEGYMAENSCNCYTEPTSNAYIYDSGGGDLTPLEPILSYIQPSNDNFNLDVLAEGYSYRLTTYKPNDGYTQDYKRTELMC